MFIQQINFNKYLVLIFSTYFIAWTINKKIPKSMLCLDGGGVKGIIEALILRHLHYALQIHHKEGDGNLVSDKIRKSTNFIQTSNNDDQLDYDEISEPYLHKIFDIISGTSTGSIIASAISRLSMNTKKLIKELKIIAPLVFGKTWSSLIKRYMTYIPAL